MLLTDFRYVAAARREVESCDKLRVGVLVINIGSARVDQGEMESFKWKAPTLLSRSLSNSSSTKIYSNTDIKCYVCRTARVNAKCNANVGLHVSKYISGYIHITEMGI